VTRAEAGTIRNKKQYQECSTQKNGVYFTTSTLQAMRRERMISEVRAIALDVAARE
jgi:DNA mismatch repair ATPase MutS